MALSTEELIQNYVRLRDKRSAMKKEFEAKDKQLDELMEQIEGRLMATINETGVTSLTCKGVGTAYVQPDMKVSCKDWGAFDKWVLQTGNTSAFERRVSRSFIKEYMEANNGMVPPAVDTMVTRKIVIRRD